MGKFMLFLLCPLVLVAQKPICGNDSVFMDSTQRANVTAADARIREFLGHYPAAIERAPITIPIVVHVVWKTHEENIADEVILSQIEVLNQYYNAENEDVGYTPEEFRPVVGKVGLRFCLAAVDPLGKPTTGIVRTSTDIPEIGFSDDLFYTENGGSDAWDTEKYLNIWVANLGEDISGLGTYPGQAPPEKTGVVVHPKYFGLNGHPKYGLGKTTAHEIGHYFGLKHIWGDDTSCDLDDDVPDTPPQQGAHTGCPFYPQSGCSGSEMFMNFMDYTDDDCMVMFTQGQSDRIWATIGAFRPGLITHEIDCMAPLNLEGNPLLIYPNPSATGLFRCQYARAPMRMVNYTLYNPIGQCLQQESLLINDAFSIDLQMFPSGLYLLRIEHDMYKLVKK